MGFAPPIRLPAMEDSCIKSLVKKECVSSSSSVAGQSLPMSQSDFHREKRQVRAEIVRCKRAGVVCDDELMTKKRKLDDLCIAFFPSVAPSTTQVDMDANKTRQLRNRESAERSRLKKDILVDTLTYQVLQCKLQLSDLKDENQWLREQLLVSSGCCSSPYSGSTVSSGVTTCDEAENSDSEDSFTTRSQSATACSSPMAKVHMYSFAPQYSTAPYQGPDASSMSFNSSNSSSYSYSSPVSGYSSPSDDDLLDDCADIIDSWFLEEGQLTL